ncbi:2-C-methyl-D-erythritol 4-phosphate cytidylyltransferase [Kytococcus sp. Marseille-QA3725]
MADPSLVHDPDAPSGVGVVVVAAGAGTRLGADVPKAFVEVEGASLLVHALQGVRGSGLAREVVVVAPAGWEERAHGCLLAAGLDHERVRAVVVTGGAERTDSVAAGLGALSGEVGCVLVHDAARCFAPPEVFRRVAGAVHGGAAAVVPGVLVVDTIKVVEPAEDGSADAERVRSTPARSSLRAVQTPQGFRRAVLERAHATGASGAAATDDALLVEQLGEEVVVVPGDPRAAKITTPQDLLVAGARS